MKRYVLSTLPNDSGDHEVHVSSCYELPSYTYQKDLGYHFNCSDAIKAARTTHSSANGCYHCNRVCHTAEVEV